MTLKFLRPATFLLAVLFANGCAGSTGTRPKVTHIHLQCRVYVDARGVVKNAHILNIEPAIAMTDKAKHDLMSMALLGKTFTPNEENGKPVAGYLTVPLDIDFDLPVPLDGV